MYSCTSLQCRSSRWHEQSVRALPGYYTSINGTVRCSATMSDDVWVGGKQKNCLMCAAIMSCVS